MATLKGSSIASTYIQLVKRADTYSQTGTNIELMIADGTIAPTGLYLESGATTDNVGIGIAAPAAQLHIGGSNPQIRIGDDGAEDTSLCFMGNSQDFYIALDDTTDDLTIGTGTTIGSNVKMVVENGGKVGIGTAAPDMDLEIEKTSANVTLKINAVTAANDAQIQLATGDSPDWLIQVDGSAANDPLHFYDYESGSSMMVLNNGKVGIGTIVPSKQLTVAAAGGGVLSLRRDHDSITNDQVLGAIHFEALDTDGTNVGLVAQIRCITAENFVENQNEGSSLHFEVTPNTGEATVEAMKIEHNGYVGIGTATPASTLQVISTLTIGNAGNDGVINTPASLYINIDSDDNASGEIFQIACNKADSTAGDELFTVLENGNVGIGVTDPAQKLEVNTVDDNTDCFIKLDADVDNTSGIEMGDQGTVYWKIYHHPGDADKLKILDDNGDGAIMTQGETSAWDWSSDINLKTDISSISNALSKINSIRGVNYKWKKYKEGAVNPNPDDITSERWAEIRTKRDINRIGVIAQEVNEVMPEAVNTDNDGEWTVKRGLLVPLLIEAVKELSAKVTALENA